MPAISTNWFLRLGVSIMDSVTPDGCRQGGGVKAAEYSTCLQL
jgi:hypothetical protein